MKGESSGLIIGISIGVVIGVLLAISTLFCFRYQRRRSQIGNSSSRRATTIPIRINGADSCTILSDSTLAPESPVKSGHNGMSQWLDGFKKSNVVATSGILEYSYRDLQKATSNFTTVIGQGAFGPVYRAQMAGGETVAVKVLATDSKQGEKEFQTEVMLLGRLHHRNLVNLVGYCAEKAQHILVYVYMSKGSVASHLYGGKNEPLSWDLRVRVALDVARGLEYLHDGAVPPVIHRDIKSSNILLDDSMRARVADFGLSREEMVDKHVSNIRGTFGYLDPEYISTRKFTKKSDVYSFGVLLFELIAGRTPQQGLMEYVELGKDFFRENQTLGMFSFSSPFKSLERYVPPCLDVQPLSLAGSVVSKQVEEDDRDVDRDEGNKAAMDAREHREMQRKTTIHTSIYMCVIYYLKLK
ncbi:calcium/calmodulin-regulated receptor-like kinase 1 isoform X2 [Cucurbita maxima]|uniref:Calcium/calmodulin-regulated receptor-like kinase 1 isoform X2 n=1 Tax=Cucurbita maxima TaxID=3661 RepID=A0A6J1IMD0_CUCMA|nr:calcium/calmodulin-regulated receptor-like kinase 1 isoform X2 [Cucurbita maxima]